MKQFVKKQKNSLQCTGGQKSGDFNVGKLILGNFFHAMYKIHMIKIHYILVNQTENKKKTTSWATEEFTDS